jgi:hypothetical protein
MSVSGSAISTVASRPDNTTNMTGTPGLLVAVGSGSSGLTDRAAGRLAMIATLLGRTGRLSKSSGEVAS